LMGK